MLYKMKEDKWVMEFNRDELETLVKCLKFGQHAHKLSSKSKDIKFIKNIIRIFG